MSSPSTNITATVLMAWALQAAAAPVPVAEYAFGGSFASSTAGAPAVVETNPLGTSGFGLDTVFGTSRTVYNFNGARPIEQQSGLSLDATSLIGNPNLYSIEIAFKFTENANAWRRIVDVESRQSDNGFYVSPGNVLDIYPVGGGAEFTNNVYHDVVLSNNNGVVSFFLDGGVQATLTTSVMNLQANKNINFFLDNVVGGGQQEYSSGSVAFIRVYDTALSSADIPVVPVIPSVPEPESMAMMFTGLGLTLLALRRKSPPS